MACTVACDAGRRGSRCVAEEVAERRAGCAAGLWGVRRRHSEVWGSLRSGVAAQGGDVAAAPANGVEEGNELWQTAAGATGLEMRK